MARAFDFYVKKGNTNVPFRSYTVNFQDGASGYFYTQEENVYDKLSNRWRVLHYCGKRFIINEDTPDQMEVTPNQMEVTPNDVVVIHYVASWKKIWFACMLSFLGFIVGYLINIVFPFSESTFWGFMQGGFICAMVFVTVGCFISIKEVDNKEQARLWNEVMIPEDKLK
jgi:hypothetical protein